jgi:hypothetical protein
MRTITFVLFVVVNLTISCSAQSNEDRMVATTEKVIDAIKSGDAQKVEKLIGVELSTMGKDEEMLALDVKKCKAFFEKYLSKKKISILLANEYSEFGKRNVIMPIYNGQNSEKIFQK